MRERQEYVTTLTLDNEDIKAFDDIQLILDGIEDYGTLGVVVVTADEMDWDMKETLENLIKSCTNVLALL